MKHLQNNSSENPLAIQLHSFSFVNRSLQLLLVLSVLAVLGLAGCGGGASNEAGAGGSGLPTGA